MKALSVQNEALLNLNQKELIKAFSKGQCPDSVELTDEAGNKFVLKKD